MTARYLVCLALLIGLLVCANETVLTTSIETRGISTSNNLSTSSAEPKAESPFKVVGQFTNVRGNGEHERGYSVQLWRQDDKIYGLILGSDSSRLIGDPPTGLLEDVQFDSKTGKLSFRAKLSLGSDGNNTWSRDVYEFRGVLTKINLTGSLLVTNELCPDKCPQKKKITLPKSKEWSLAMAKYNSYKSYPEWKEYADKILKFLGPRW